MNTLRSAVLILMMLTFSSCTSPGDVSQQKLGTTTALPPTETSGARNRPAETARGVENSAAPKIRNGTATPWAEFPATFAFYSQEGKKCTGVFVGDHVLLTAAHCIGGSRKGSIQLNGTRQCTCEPAPEYSPGNPTGASADWALCLMDEEIEEIRNLPFERLNDQPSRLRSGGELLLTGFGCSAGEFQTGAATIASLPNADSHFIRMSEGADLCNGDSGGPSFLLLAGSRVGPRRVAGVNARIDSSLASVSTSKARSFFEDWATRKNAPICGVSPGAQNCRN
jgi:hypothetical protein